MIRITVELVPGGVGKPRHLGTAIITNDGEGTIDTGNYTVSLSKWGQPDKTWRKGKVTDFPRRRLGPWDLLYRALHSAVGSRNNGH